MYAKLPAVVLLLAVGSASAAAIAGVSYGTEKTFKEDPDFGLCLPTIKYEGGLGGRSATDFAFLPADPLCAKGQQEALNPSKPAASLSFTNANLASDIVTNRICDQLTTACGANEAAKQLCREAQTKIRALGTRNKSTADTWNTLMGFGGALTNPDGGLTDPADRDLKKRELTNEKRAFIACSASEWIDDCTGWPAPEPVVKRDVKSAPEPVVKRSVEAPVPAEEVAKRAVPFKPCSASVWIDDCTGWP